MVPDVIVTVKDKTDVAAARRAAVELAGFDEKHTGALSIVVTEASTNLLKHGAGGDIILRKSGSSVDVLAIDRGPGASNLYQCFEDGYSTAGSPGTGLGAIARASTFCDAYSAPDKGVVLMARVGPEARNGSGPEIGAVCAPFPGEKVSGDAWACEHHGPVFRLAVADGLGHGTHADEASRLGIEAVMHPRNASLIEAIQDAHARLRVTRGAALSIAEGNTDTGTLIFSGVGNVTGIVVQDPASRRQMVSINGTLGHVMRKAQEYQYPLRANSLVVMHSDGVSASWSLDKYPGLFNRHPSVIAGVLFRDFRRTRDDATIVVARTKRREL